jgi:hypothetical protein
LNNFIKNDITAVVTKCKKVLGRMEFHGSDALWFVIGGVKISQEIVMRVIEMKGSGGRITGNASGTPI